MPVLDDLERALGAATRHEEAKLEDGVLKIRVQKRKEEIEKRKKVEVA